MVDSKLQLTREEMEILDGKKGETLQKAMKSIVLYGEAFGAKRLVPVNGSVHLVTSFGIPILEPVFDMMEELISNGLVTEKPFTVNPRPLDYKNIKCGPIKKVAFKIMYGKQNEYEQQLSKVGLKDCNSFSCTCYEKEVGNIPSKGEILAWAESSAVVYANSVLGARTNRNSGVIELLSGIVGRTPEFGLLTDEGRKAKWLIELKTSQLPNAHLLGSAIGKKVVEDVPYIVGLDSYFKSMSTKEIEDYLKDMGAASASNGAVGLYHVENITPEAKESGRALLKESFTTYIIDDEVLKATMDSYSIMWKNPDMKPKLCFIGCPHLSLNQLYEWTEKINEALKKEQKSKIAVRTILTAAPDVISKFKEDSENYNRLISTGARLSYICPLMYMNNPICSKEPVITNSNKLRTYTTARFYETDNIIEKIIKGI